LVDIPISNCINSNIRKIYLLTQFNSASLHRHISQSYKFDQFSDGFVEILAAEQTFSSSTWYQGTADAVRKNLLHFAPNQNRYFLVLSGDQLYRMDFRGIINQHVETNADLTVATIVKGQRDVSSLGIMQIDETRQVINFVEKPTDADVQESLKLPKKWHSRFGIQGEDDCYLASMGIYVFKRGVLEELLTNNDSTDFGRHIIPEAIKTHRVFSYIFQGYWEDIGTIRSFFEANLAMTDELPPFDFFNMNAPIYSRPRFLPASKVNGANVRYAAISDGCIINHAHLTQCVVGLRTVIERNANLKRSSSWEATTTSRRNRFWRAAPRESPKSASGKIRSSKTRSLIKGCASAPTASLNPTASPTRWIIRPCITSGMGSWSSPKTRLSPITPLSSRRKLRGREEFERLPWEKPGQLSHFSSW
jgi:glucose-1-phosphate adenylyltransferase